MTWVWMVAGLLLLAAVLSFVVGRPALRRREEPEPGQARVLLREEQAQVRKTREQLADVTMRTELSQELTTFTVPVTREELVVERNGVEVARIPLREERVDVSTHVVPLNEVSVHRRQWEDTRQIQAVLKKQVARIEATGDAEYVEATNSPDSGLT